MSDAVGTDRDDALRARMMRYTVAAMFFVGFAGKGVRGIFGDIGSLVPMLILLVSFVVLFWTSGRSLLLRRFPTTTCLFVAWCALSCLWSVAPAQSAQFAVLSLALTLVWLGLCGAVLLLTQSATVALSTVGCFLVIAGLVVQRRVPERLRLRVVGGFAGIGVLTAIAAFFCRHMIADAFGRSPDMSGRSVIWHAVAPLVAQRPIGGWGWFIGWPTWMEPFASLVIRPDGTPTNQAHNVYVEAALTTGFVGAAMITVAIVWTLYRVVKVAVAHIDDNLWDVIPAVIIIAMFIQSFTESRLLFEGNWMLFVMIATWVKVRGEVPVVWPSAARQHLEYS